MVIFHNTVLELIQYRPVTERVFGRPLIIVPPQINKFYLFDLAPGRSLIEYLLKAGFQVFVVSWRNPTAEQHDWNMDTYVEALLEAIDAARDITGSADINLAGACSGAMTVAALLGHLAAEGHSRVFAVTMMVVLLDRDEDSQIGLFATPEAIAAAKQASSLKGVLSGQDMGRMFAWMRPNDLVWNYWINNYLLGNPPPAYDLLYWNNDTTRLPASFHGQLLDVFLQNLFRTRGALMVLGTPIDLGQVKCDKYVVAGMTDHITPWRGGYRAAQLFGGTTKFVLSSSGHIQSIINPPGNTKATYFVNTVLSSDADEWLAGATRQTGSWWDHWRQWLTERSGPSVAAPPKLETGGTSPVQMRLGPMSCRVEWRGINACPKLMKRFNGMAGDLRTPLARSGGFVWMAVSCGWPGGTAMANRPYPFSSSMGLVAISSCWRRSPRPSRASRS